MMTVCLSLQLSAEDFAFNKSLEKYCFNCHDEDVQKGEVRLDNLADLELNDRLELLNRVQEQLYIQEMPPKNKKHPTIGERTKLIDGLTVELKKYNAYKLAEKLKKFEYANYVDHDKLFSGQYKNLKGYTDDRHWLISEFIFNEKINGIIGQRFKLAKVHGRKYQLKGVKTSGLLTNPFLLPSKSGVRYYANENLHGGHLLTMLSNSRILADMMIDINNKAKTYLPAVNEIMAMKNSHLAELKTRRNFLENNIEELCQQLYGNKHETLLPDLVPLNLPKAKKSAGKVKLSLGGLGRDQSDLVDQAVGKYYKENINFDHLVDKCYKYWFYAGHDSRKIINRITYMKNYWARIKGNLNRITKQRTLADLKVEPNLAKIYNQTILKHRQKGDNYKQIIEKCIIEWEEELKKEHIQAGPPNKETINTLINQLFVKLYNFEATKKDLQKYNLLTAKYIQKLGTLPAIKKLIQTLILRTEFVYRNEYGQGVVDKHGRRMLSPRDASYAISYAITDSNPDVELVKAAQTGRLNTKEDYEREIKRLLTKRKVYTVVDLALLRRRKHHDNLTNQPIRKLRFFREFFGYPKMMQIFKDDKRFGHSYSRVRTRLVEECDMWVENILEKDENVFEELLTSDKFYVFHSGNNNDMKKYSDRFKTIYDYFKDKNWQKISESDELISHATFFLKMGIKDFDSKKLKKDKKNTSVKIFMKMMNDIVRRFDSGQKNIVPYGRGGLKGPVTRANLGMSAPQLANFFNIDLENWDYPTTQPTTVENRKGILTHPAWLIAHSQNTETDPVHRGKWIREKLLAGTIPDIPVTVDAVVPDNPHKTLRQRYDEKVKVKYCWKCHERMNPLGYAFEIYDDFGRFRTEESLEYPDNLVSKNPDKTDEFTDTRDIYKTLPVNSKGYLKGTENKTLDGEVKDALELIDRLGKSTRVRQSIIRHAFRYFLGRNEQFHDSKTLIDAEQVYLKSNGSFDALIVSLLTSDSFIYRKAVKE